MKRAFLAICCTTLLWAGCKENDPPIDFGNNALVDTTYVLPPSKIPSSPDAHNVLIEEFTGQGCSACPAAHDILESIVSGNASGRVNVVGLYITNFLQTIPPTGSVHDFRDSSASAIENSIYGSLTNGLPSGGVDRAPYNSQMLLSKDLFANAVTNRLNIPDSLNLSVSSAYDATTKKATITALVTYIYQVSTQQNLSVAIVEDTMYDYQEDGLKVDSGYLFTNVFRGMITSVPLGDVLGTATIKEPGRVFQKVYSYTPKTLTAPNPPINPRHCRVIAFVNKTGANGDYSIVQSAQCKLWP